VIERLLQILLVTMSGFGMAMLAELDQSRQMQFFFMVASIASIVIVDSWKWTAIPRWAANLLALVAMLACARKFYSGGQAFQLSAVADLLLYLQLILFFQEKQQRVYWVLLVLGLLRVIVASTTEPEAYFAPLLLLFLASAIGALTCFYLWREEDRIKIGASALQKEPPEVAMAPSDLAPGSLELAKVRVAQPTRAEFLRPVPIESRRLFWGITRETAKITLFTLVLAAVFFAVMPRIGENGWAMAQFGRALTGFSPDVQLHQIASLQQNPEPVFRLRLEDAYSQAPLRVDAPLYIQGNVLRFYGRLGAGTRYAWVKGDPGVAPIQEINTIPIAPGSESLVRQSFTLDAPVRGNGVIFAIYPFFRASTTPREFRLIDKGNTLYGRGPAGFEYSLLTSAFIRSRQSELRPVDNREDPNYLDLVSFEETRFPGLMAKCDAILEASPGAAENRLQLANALTEHLRASGEYIYSVDRSNIRLPTGMDPIEDFVTTSKKGYCQYFASALALMLRYRNIPSRIVNGYCTNEYNEVGGYYQVRQYHSHVWVEAYLRNEDLAAFGSAVQAQHPRGAWVRLDATPEGELPAFQTNNSTVASDSMNFAQILWRDYVVGLNTQRQQKSVYDPFKSTFFDSAKALFDANAWRDWWARVSQMNVFREFLSGNWFNWRGGVAAMSLAAGLYLAYHFLLWIYVVGGEYWKFKREKRSLAKSRSNVEFYDRFESMLKRLGFVRDLGQTPREFAHDISPSLASSVDPKWNGNSDEFIRLYYGVRFGDQILDQDRQEQIEQILKSLSEASQSVSKKS
jgi:protein-glutamine gamma-glutamyltransferase